MLSAIVERIQATRPDKIGLATAAALKNSWVFAPKNMQRKVETDAIMTIICKATKCNDIGVRVVA